MIDYRHLDIQVLGHSRPHQLRDQEDEGPGVPDDPAGLAGQLYHLPASSDRLE